jgi:hypothetical protein
MSFSKKVLTLIEEYNNDELDEVELGQALYDLDMDSNGTYGAFEDAHTQLQGEWIQDNHLDWSDEQQAYVTEDGESYGEYEGPYGSNDWRDLYTYFAENVLKQAKALENKTKECTHSKKVAGKKK